MRTQQLKFFDKRLTVHFSVLISSIVLLCLPLSSMAESIGCDDNFVQLDNNALVINVATTGADDTVNIQCALDVAASDGYPIVRLAEGTYFVSGLMVENFKGTLEGKTRATTTIEVPDRSVDCLSGMESMGLTSAVIKFVNGEPRIRFMTIQANRPCSSTGSITSILHFTGESTQVGNCANDVIFGSVDRVALEGAEISNWINIGVLVSAEGNQLDGCKDTLLGTFKLNRSTVSNIWWGIKTTMKSGAQVDINFNEFLGNNRAIWLQDTNQNTTITSNTIVGEATAEKPYYGIYTDTNSIDAPNATRVVVNNNQFDVTSSPTASAIAVFALQTGRLANVSSIVTNNRFVLSGNRAFGVWHTEVSNAHVSANRFDGDGHTAIGISGMSPVTGWSVTANKGLTAFSAASGADIWLAVATSQCIIGPGQGAAVLDNGTDNSILPQ